MPPSGVVPLVKKSTNGRLLRALRRAQFRVLARVAPSLSDRKAAALFLTPPRRRASEPGTPGLSAQRLSVLSGDVQLAVWAWGHGPTVLLVHGWSGHAGQLGSFIRPLVEAGFRVVAFDLPAHGHSSGRRTTVLKMAEALQALALAIGPLHSLVGHSLGGTAAALALFDNLPASRVVLLAPPAAPQHFVRKLAAVLGLSDERAEGMLAQVQRQIGVHLPSLDVRLLAGWMRQPALIFHDVADREVPFAQGRAIAEAWPAARLVPLTGLGHTRILADPDVVRATVAFLREGAAGAAVPRQGVATSG